MSGTAYCRMVERNQAMKEIGDAFSNYAKRREEHRRYGIEVEKCIAKGFKGMPWQSVPWGTWSKSMLAPEGWYPPK